MAFSELQKIKKRHPRHRHIFSLNLDFRAVDDESGTAPANKPEGTHVFHPFQE